MRKPFQVSFLSAEARIYEGPAVSLTVPAGLGEMGIWADHMPYLTTLRPGRILLKKSEDKASVAYKSLGKGFCEVNKSHVTLLVDS
jgi:F-type H+-transporting ATPase subunit epsilon